jgi:hypothetical protein
VRLLRDVVRCPADDRALADADADLGAHRWARELAADQRADGSWGRFHSRDSRRRDRFPTSEFAIRRAVALGIRPGNPILASASAFMVAVLDGRAAWPDPAERGGAWPIIVEAVTAGTLAQVDPANPALDRPWRYWARIAERALTSGVYDPGAERAAHRELSGVPLDYLGSRYVIALLGARADRLPASTERRLVEWIARRREGIGYLGADLHAPPGRNTAAWLETLDLLAPFPTAPGLVADALAHLLATRRTDGTWDFGGRPIGTPLFPLSDDWRGTNRSVDHTTAALAVLRRYAKD